VWKKKKIKKCIISIFKVTIQASEFDKDEEKTH
jgi:hypothetical protein